MTTTLGKALTTAIVLSWLALLPGDALAQPTFTKTFSPDTIGPGSATALTFFITNGSGTALTDLAFTDNLPAGVTLASPAVPSTDCVGGILTAPDGGTTISYAGGGLGAFATCTVQVLVTSSTVGTHMNVSGDLTSNGGNSGPAIADLTVATDRPSFSKSFSPAAIQRGARSTLTFTIDNSANGSPVFSLSFSDPLPSGLVVADPANASTTCTGGVLSAVPGSSTFSYGPQFGGDASVTAGASCTVSVDTITTGGGTLDNVSGELTSSSLGPPASSGLAVASLVINVDTIDFAKSFLDDPTLPGDTVDLQFTLRNLDRSNPATNIEFTDDLDATLSGLVATGLPANDVCGSGSILSGTSLLSLTGGNLAAGDSCTFSVTLQVPAAAIPGAYPNVTSSLTADLGGSPYTGNPASETLFVDVAPVLTKTFLTNPVGSGEVTSIEFTITNSSPTDPVTDITFSDNITQFLSDATIVGLPAAGFCGPGSTAFVFTVVGELTLMVNGGSLAAGGSCTFTVDLMIAAGAPGGDFVNTTSNISGTIAGTTRIGKAASATLTIAEAPDLAKEFTDDPVQPGDTVTLEFTLTHDEFSASDATGISFTDDLDAALSGLVAVGLPANDVCGTGSQISGTSTLSFTGGTLAPGETCVFSVLLQVPAGAIPGTYTNSTSAVVADVGAVSVVGGTASDFLEISGLTLTKEFIDDPVIPGDTTTLRFTLANTSASSTATGIFFTDNVGAVIPGMTAQSPLPDTSACGAASSLSGTSTLIFAGGELSAGASCSFDVILQVPVGTATDTYSNTTSNLVALIDSNPATLDPAFDSLMVSSEALLLTKSFTDDPVAPGEMVTLEFSLTNMDPSTMVTALTFTDDLDAALSGLTAVGLPAMGFCGAGSTLTGSSLLTLAGASLAPGATCTFSATLMVPAGVPLGAVATNTTSAVTGSLGGLPVDGAPASDDLLLNFLSLTKSFDGPTTAGGTAELTFTIQNLSSTATVADLEFSDDLTAALPGLVATGLPQNDVCGTGSQISGTSFLTFTGGELLPSASCSFIVTVAIPGGTGAGTYTNTTSDLIQAGLVAGTPATADLTIEPPPTFAKVFAPDFIGVGQVSTLTFTIDNSASALAATSLDFTDNLPAGMLVATPANAATTCTGGTLTAVAGTGVVSYTGGSVAAGATCTVTADVTAGSAGALDNLSGDLTSSSGNSGNATDTLTVNPQPGFAKAFAPNPIIIGGVSTLTFTIDNGASTVDATSLDFTDNLPAGMLVATPANAATTCTGGTLTAVAGSGTVSYTGGSVTAGTTCTATVDVTVSVAGSLVNTSGALTSSLGTSSDIATDTLVVDPPPTFTKAFSPDTITAGGVSLLTLTIDNSASTTAATGLDFTDNLPTDLLVATPANAATTCTGGTLTAVAGSGTVSYTGGSVAAGATCTVTVDVTTAVAGAYLNTTGDLTSSLGNSGGAVATLAVDLALPAFSKAFAPDPIPVGGVSTLTLTIDNPVNASPVGNLGFTDNLPAGLVVATPPNAATTCTGGTLTAVAGSGTVSYTGGTVAALSSCIVTVDVTSDTPGAYTNVTGDLTSDAGNSGTATAVLNVIESVIFTKTFIPNPVLRGGLVDVEYTITNPSSSASLSALAFTDDLGAAVPGLAAVGLPASDVCGTGSVLSGTSVLTFGGGSLPAGGSCTFGATLQVPAAAALGIFPSTTSSLSFSASIPLVGGGFQAPPASADLEIVFLEFTKAFAEPMVIAGDTITLTFSLVNPDPVNGVSNITFTDDLDAALPGMVAINLPLMDVCGAGSEVSGSSIITLTGGSLAPGGSCLFDVEVEIPLDSPGGVITNITSALTATVAGQTVQGDPTGVAQADLEIDSNPVVIPTLGTWGLLLMAALTALTALFLLRRRTQPAPRGRHGGAR
ncbi:MAG: hypothetical protein SX243_18080 [Acidobacteriota bacterium]|nr:hypothetical protein [Acidobacteriota bacterium]